MCGRTVKTFRDAVDSEQARWKNFRRTLKPAHREYLDRIFNYAREYADAGTMVPVPRVTEVVFMATMMEAMKEIDTLRDKIQALKDG
ncbi:MAG: hypothetical protein GF309_08765 [Candidatus Lokiarchaeota archaeon]|jgi:hypothetical protein|nr:hypothetical protein [Candidatus Lokiarchaeota archaeon]